MNRYWDEKNECTDMEELRELQGVRLKDTVGRVYGAVPYYRKKMKDMGIEPGDIRSVDDLSKLPFTTKSDLRDNYPFGTFALPMEDVVRIHASSGTTGKSTVVGYTKEDIEMWSDCVARCLTSAGIGRGDIVHVAYGYGLFTGGLGLHYGCERAGAAVVPASGGNTKRQLQLISDFKATVLCCTPSYAIHLADAMTNMGMTKDDICLRAGIFGAEAWSEPMRWEIEDKLGLKAYDIYGLSEIMGPGVSMSCSEQNGLHIQADHFIAEIIDPDTGENLPEGKRGEIVFTCITKKALPLIRYRTRDLTSLNNTKCACGRTMPRMDKVTGRSDDMLIIRGVNVFPSQIESVIVQFSEVEPHYMIYVDRISNLDILEVQIEMNPSIFSDEVKVIEGLERKLTSAIDSTLGISATVKLVEPSTLPRSEGKAVRVMDRRQIFEGK